MAVKKYKKADEVQIDGNKIYSPVRKKWLPLTPEEQVRQQYLTVLNELYPQPNNPENTEKTCLEWYREFVADPSCLAVVEGME